MATGDPLFNPRLPEFHANPYPFYHGLRENDPVHQSPMGFWVFILRRMLGLALQTATPEWRESSNLRRLKALPVTF